MTPLALAVHGHHEVVAGAGRGDVEEPESLVVVHLFVGNHASPTSAEVLYEVGWDPEHVELLDVLKCPEQPAPTSGATG